MKLSKFLLVVFSLTLFSLLYVWQQTEIFRLAYVGQKKFSTFENLLDKNSILRYNLKSDTSLIQMGDKLAKTNDFGIPDTYWLVRADNNKQNLNIASRPASNRLNLVSRIFSVKRQVEAKTISP